MRQIGCSDDELEFDEAVVMERRPSLDNLDANVIGQGGFQFPTGFDGQIWGNLIYFYVQIDYLI